MVSILYSVYFCACYLALILPRLCKLSHKKALALQVLFSVIMRTKSCKRFIKSIDFSPYMDIMLYVKQFYMRQILSKGGSKIKNGRISVGKEVHSLDNLIGRYIEMCAYTDERFDGITGTNGRILDYIARRRDSDVFQRDIEREFCITRSTASKVLTLMEQKGFIERRSVPGDARLKKLVLTDISVQFTDMMHENIARIEAVLTDGVSKEELRAFITTVEKMKENLRAQMK